MRLWAKPPAASARARVNREREEERDRQHVCSRANSQCLRASPLGRSLAAHTHPLTQAKMGLIPRHGQQATQLAGSGTGRTLWASSTELVTGNGTENAKTWPGHASTAVVPRTAHLLSDGMAASRCRANPPQRALTACSGGSQPRTHFPLCCQPARGCGLGCVPKSVTDAAAARRLNSHVIGKG